MMKSNWRVYNLTLTNANQEYSQELVRRPCEISIKSRDPNANLKFTFTSGESGTTYTTIFGGSEWSSKGEVQGVKTVFVQSDTAGTVVEIELWT